MTFADKPLLLQKNDTYEKTIGIDNGSVFYGRLAGSGRAGTNE
jgi:hypothetical protein